MPNLIAVRAPGPACPRWVAFCRCGCKGRCGSSTWQGLRAGITRMTHTSTHQQRRYRAAA